mmetsp:Transcript_19409/g.57509  ORF Transcript_19409/g.57509 Transcript_19409/m.57509 type:complete len:340 (-) Transcript_19409:287-1306(-)
MFVPLSADPAKKIACGLFCIKQAISGSGHGHSSVRLQRTIVWRGGLPGAAACSNRKYRSTYPSSGPQRHPASAVHTITAVLTAERSGGAAQAGRQAGRPSCTRSGTSRVRAASRSRPTTVLLPTRSSPSTTTWGGLCRGPAVLAAAFALAAASDSLAAWPASAPRFCSPLATCSYRASLSGRSIAGSRPTTEETETAGSAGSGGAASGAAAGGRGGVDSSWSVVEARAGGSGAASGGGGGDDGSDDGDGDGDGYERCSSASGDPPAACSSPSATEDASPRLREGGAGREGGEADRLRRRRRLACRPMRTAGPSSAGSTASSSSTTGRLGADSRLRIRRS